MTASDVTSLVSAWSGGDRAALDRLMPLVYDDLRRIAGNQLRAERRDHTLSATAVVHEVYLRLLGQRAANLAQRAQFFALASGLMRRILVDHARRRLAAKRGGETVRLQLDENLVEADARSGSELDLDLLTLDSALEELQAFDPRLVRIIELRFFGGLSLEEMTAELQLSRTTVTREWALAKSWLHRRLNQGSATPPPR
jgi:RNA polymerase sigma factor (TIGR02999 family)